MLPQTVRVFRTGFSRSDREFEEALRPCRETSVSRQGEARRQPQAIEHSHVAVLAEGLGACPRWQQAMTPRDYAACDAVDREPREPLRRRFDLDMNARMALSMTNLAAGDTSVGSMVR